MDRLEIKVKMVLVFSRLAGIFVEAAVEAISFKINGISD